MTMTTYHPGKQILLDKGDIDVITKNILEVGPLYFSLLMKLHLIFLANYQLTIETIQLRCTFIVQRRYFFLLID